jgi:ankyrin repeat protein
MAEAIGTISAILTVVETSVSTSLKLYHFFTTIRDAPRETMSISRDVRNFNTLVQNLRAALTSADVQRIVSQDSQIDQALKDLLDPIDNCQQVCAQIQGKLERHFKAETASEESSGGNTTIQPLTRNHTGSIRWYFRRGEILALIGRFQLTKGMFSDAMGGLTLWVLGFLYFCIGRTRLIIQRLLTFKASSMMSGGVTNTHISVNHASDDDVNHSTTLRMGRKHKFDDDAGSAFLQYAQQRPTDDLSKTTTLVHALEKGSDPKYAKELLGGVRRGSAVSVELVLDHVDIDAREPHTGRTALSIAAELGNIKITELLLIRDATVNTRQYSRSNPYLRNSPHRHPIMTSGRSPLHWAISGSHSMIVELLLQYGANPNSRNSVGRSVLQDACMKNDLKSARLLLQNGADVNARSYNHVSLSLIVFWLAFLYDTTKADFHVGLDAPA